MRETALTQLYVTVMYLSEQVAQVFQLKTCSIGRHPVTFRFNVSSMLFTIYSYNAHCRGCHAQHTQLEAWHSIECITDADHSIGLNKTVLHGCVVARRDGRAGPSRCATTHDTTQVQRDGAARLSRRDVMHFVTFYMGKSSAVGQPTRPTQPFILMESINEPAGAITVRSIVALSGELRGKGRYDVLCSLTTV